MERLKNNAVDNGDVEVYPSYYNLEYPYDSVTDPDNTSIKSVGDYEM